MYGIFESWINVGMGGGGDTFAEHRKSLISIGNILEKDQSNNPKNLLYFKTTPEKPKTENILWPLFCHLATVEFTIDLVC